jgi:hypothetical protein
MDSMKQGKIWAIYRDKSGLVTLKRKLQAVFAFLRRHSWLPWSATIASSLLPAVAIMDRLDAIWWRRSITGIFGWMLRSSNHARNSPLP